MKNKTVNREINNPYKVQWKLYVFLTVLSVIGIIVGSIKQAFIISDEVLDIIKNISIGVFASSLVALMIEYRDVKIKNKKTNSIYESVYSGLKGVISFYLAFWSLMLRG